MKQPEIITICGSSRFADLMAVISWEYEKIGKIVLRVNFLPEWYTKMEGWTESSHGAEQSNLKQELDNLHFRKIDISDKVYVCNYDGYIGESTTNEINYAKNMGKPIIYLEGKTNEMTEKIDDIIRKLGKTTIQKIVPKD